MTAVKALAALSLIALLAACAGPGTMAFAPTESGPMNNLNVTHFAPGF